MKIEKRNCIRIYGLTSEQEDILKDHLTFDNPAYEKAKRYSRNRYITIPPYLTYYTLGKDNEGRYLECPIGVNVEKILNHEIDTENGDSYLLSDNFHHADYPEFVLELRKQQEEAKRAYTNYFHRKLDPHASIVSLPTGKGKTILALNIAATLKAKTLVLVHKDDLITGWKKDIDLCFGGKVKAGLIKAKSRTVGEQITLATVQTLSRMSDEELNEYTNQFGLVVQDECLVGNTLIVQSDGGVSKIEKCHLFTKVLGGEVSSPFSRKSEIYELSCKHGVFRGSPTHPTWYVERKKRGVYTFDEFKYAPLRDIPENCLIPVLYRIPHTEKHKITEDEARFLALIMCKGVVDTKRNTIKVGFRENINYYTDVFNRGCSLFDAKVNDISPEKSGRKTYVLITKSAFLILYLISLGGIVNNAFTREIPELLYGVQLSCVKAFIETVINCLGKIEVSSGLYRMRIDFNSEVFAQGFSLMLKKFGILSNFRCFKKYGVQDSDVCNLHISGEFFNNFMDTFSFIPEKTTNYRNRYTRKRDIVVGDYYLSDFKYVKPLGYEDTVYDFTVSGTNSFVANGIYTHNCHHVGLNIFNIINKFNSYHKLGLSATPKRSDGLDFVFDLFFGGICYEYKATKDDEDISNVNVEVIDSGYKYRPFIYEGQVFNYYDFTQDELPDKITFLDELSYKDRPIVSFHTIEDCAIRSSKTRVIVCKKILEHYRMRHSCIVMFTQKEHINLYYHYLKLYMPEKEILLFYGDSKEKFESIKEKAESKEAHVTLATFAKSTEGTNVKAWEVEFLVSSLNNEKNVEQATGRVRRRKEGKIDPVIVYDIRYSQCYSLASHYNTRKKVYDSLDYNVHDDRAVEMKQKSIFSRGYKR